MFFRSDAGISNDSRSTVRARLFAMSFCSDAGACAHAPWTIRRERRLAAVNRRMANPVFGDMRKSRRPASGVPVKCSGPANRARPVPGRARKKARRSGPAYRAIKRARTSLRIRLRLRLQPAILLHRIDVRRAPTPGLVELGKVLGVAAREDHLAEAVAVGTGQAAVFLEPAVGIVGQH